MWADEVAVMRCPEGMCYPGNSMVLGDVVVVTADVSSLSMASKSYLEFGYYVIPRNTPYLRI
jgi:hypothetical protein